MPVSYLPITVTLLLVGMPLLILFKGRKEFVVASSVSGFIVVSFLLFVYVPGWFLMIRAHSGDQRSQYELARWTENHDEQIGTVCLWPFEPDVLGGYAQLEKASSLGYLPAMWLVGVRLKYGLHVPKPSNWKGARGNVFPQPERGQILIDRATALGYSPHYDEKLYYWQVYRNSYNYFR